MESNSESKQINIKNSACYYFDDIMRVADIDFYQILLEEKANENILIYGISYKIFIGAKPLRIRFDEIDVYIKIYDN